MVDTGVGDPDKLAVIRITGVYLVDGAPTITGVHETIIDEWVNFVFWPISARVLHSTQRQGPHHTQTADILSVDLREPGVAGRGVVAVHDQPVPWLVLGVDQSVAVYGKAVLSLDGRGGCGHQDSAGQCDVCLLYTSDAADE